MLNKIIDAVCLALHRHFGDEYVIYKEKIPQGFTQPCFSVHCEESENGVFLGRRHLSKNKIVINFYTTESENKREVCNYAADNLPPAIEYIEADGIVIPSRGAAVVKNGDGCSCTAWYDYFYYINEEVEIMENINMEVLDNKIMEISKN